MSQASLAFDPHFNLILGPNGSGKTSLLEAIFYLGRGRSFRSRRLERIIQANTKDFTLFGEVLVEELPSGIGIGASLEGTDIRIRGQKAANAAELSMHCAPHIIDPEVHKLLEEGPHRRRRFMDFGVFHVEQSFLEVWYRYTRALKQRNAWLKGRVAEGDSCPFDIELIQSGEQLHAMRSAYVERLAPGLAQLGEAFLGHPVSLVYQKGFNADLNLADALNRSQERDFKFKTTHVGPHRADIAIQVAGVAAKERVSRGQQKLLAAALTLAQLKLIEDQHPGRSVLLLDDPAAELDSRSLSVLMQEAKSLSVQLFVTALEAHSSIWTGEGKRFHVEQGRWHEAG
jgi:DNA replication and repair protein RecF